MMGKNADKITMYRRRFVEALRSQTQMYLKEGKMLLRMVELEGVLHPVRTIIFGTVEEWWRQRLLRTSADRVFRNENLPDSHMLVVRFVQIFSEKMATLLKRPAVVAYSYHAVLLTFKKAYRSWLGRSGQSLVAFLSGENRENEGTSNPCSVQPCEAAY